MVNKERFGLIKERKVNANSDEAKGLQENAKAGKKGGKIAKDARLQLEQQTGKNVVTEENFYLQVKNKGN